MRAMTGILLASLLLAWVVSSASTTPHVFAQRYESSASPKSDQRDLMAIAGAVVDGQQLLILIDHDRKTLCSYQVDAQTGLIALRSVRKIRWDLELDEFNGTEPSPEKIRALLQSQ